MEGSKASVVSDNKSKADANHATVEELIPSQHNYSTGGATLNLPSINTVGAVGSDPASLDPVEGVFDIQMDGVTVTLHYKTVDAATKGRQDLVDAINKEK